MRRGLENRISRLEQSRRRTSPRSLEEIERHIELLLTTAARPLTPEEQKEYSDLELSDPPKLGRSSRSRKLEVDALCERIAPAIPLVAAGTRLNDLPTELKLFLHP